MPIKKLDINTISTTGKVSNSATTATGGNFNSTIVARDTSGNFSAGTITASLAGNVTGSSSLNVLKTGDTMSGNLVLLAGTSTGPSLNFTGSLTTGLSASAGSLTLSTSGTGAITISSAGVVAINGFIVAGIVHNDGSGNLTSSTIVNADISASASISDTKLATISTTGKVSNSATTATGGNFNSTIVARDTSGNFSAGTITASLAGNASTVTTNANMTGAIGSRGNTGSVAYIEVSATGTATVATTIDTLLITTASNPPAGIYFVTFSTYVTNSNNRTIMITVYTGINPILNSVRVATTTTGDNIHISTNCIATVNGSEAISVYWNTSAGTASSFQRTLDIIRMA